MWSAIAPTGNRRLKPATVADEPTDQTATTGSCPSPTGLTKTILQFNTLHTVAGFGEKNDNQIQKGFNSMANNDTKVERFDVPTKGTMIEGFRAFRKYLEASVGPLAKEWYEDSPEQRPKLYKDQPHLLPPPREA